LVVILVRRFLFQGYHWDISIKEFLSNFKSAISTNGSFAMTINKSQYQSLKHVGVYLSQSIFSHGQLYVALARITSKKDLKILISDGEGDDSNVT
jgi:ATP-dependent exoDNAse (exonuclease V) alpha subunit